MWSQEERTEPRCHSPSDRKDFGRGCRGGAGADHGGLGESRPCEQWEDRRCAFLLTQSSHPAHGLVTRKRSIPVLMKAGIELEEI